MVHGVYLDELDTCSSDCGRFITVYADDILVVFLLLSLSYSLCFRIH